MAEAAEEGAGRPPASRRSAEQPATRLLSIAGIATGLGAASCCVIPFLLFAAGVSGAWIDNLTALEPYQPIFAAASLGFIGSGAWRLRRKAKIACQGGYCATPRSDRIARIGLWTAAVLIVIALVLPYVIRALITSGSLSQSKAFMQARRIALLVALGMSAAPLAALMRIPRSPSMCITPTACSVGRSSSAPWLRCRA
jgi:mercuric ion transport protein